MADMYGPAWPSDGSQNSEACYKWALERIDRFFERARNVGIFDLWRKSHKQYHSGLYTGGRVAKVGAEGELRWVEINHYANLIRHVVSLTSSARQAWDAKATNVDFESINQCQLASGLLDYYWRSERFEQKFIDALFSMICYGAGGMHSPWRGGVDGDLDVIPLTPDYLVVDVDLVSGDDNWYIVRELRNKYDLAAEYPEFSGQIISGVVPNKEDYIADLDFAGSDMTEVFILYHGDTPACRGGRQMVFTRGAWLIDGPLEYARPPVFLARAEVVKGERWGYTPAFDILAIQGWHNGLSSAIASSQAAFAIQNILIPEGSNLTPDMISSGMRGLTFNATAGKPELLKLLDTPAELPRTLKMLEDAMQVMIGITSVDRGIPDASLKSGSALAMVQSMAIKFNSVTQGAYVRLLEDVGTMVIKVLQRKAAAPRVAQISGSGSRWKMKEFTGKDLDRVVRVTVDVGSPISRTPEQRQAIAKIFSEAGVKVDVGALVTLMETGRLEPFYDQESSTMDLVRDENDALMRGEVPLVLRTDDHDKHCKRHAVLLSSVESRYDDAVVTATLEHISRHEVAQRELNPDTAALIGVRPAAPSGPGGGAVGAMPGAALGGEVPAPGLAGEEGVTMPVNPATGMPVQPPQMG